MTQQLQMPRPHQHIEQRLNLRPGDGWETCRQCGAAQWSLRGVKPLYQRLHLGRHIQFNHIVFAAVEAIDPNHGAPQVPAQRMGT